jgi:hypothetical protein
VHLPTCEYTASFVKFLSAPTSSCLRHTKLPYAAISEISSLHRHSPLATQQHSPAWLPHPLISSDGRRPRLCCSTLVSLRNCTARLSVPPPAAARTTATSLHQLSRCTQPSGGWSGQQPAGAQQTGDEALWFALCRCAFPSACYPRFCSRHGSSGHLHVSITHLPTPATVTRHLANHLFSGAEGTISSISFVKDVMVSHFVFAVSVQSAQTTSPSPPPSPHLDCGDHHRPQS